MASTGTLMLATLFLAYGYRLYDPLPEGLTSPLQSAVFLAIMKITDDIGLVNSYLGLATPLNTTRFIMASSVKYLNPIGAGTLKIEDVVIEGVSVRSYTPGPENVRKFGPAIIYIHGGGWVMCDKDTHDPPMRYLAKSLGVMIYSIDYRLAPEHPFPAAYDDSLAVTKYILSNARALNINPRQIVIMGDSAGGNLAAAISNELTRENFSPRPDLQVLIYPLLQGLDLTLPSYLKNDGTAWLSRKLVGEFIAQYFGIDIKYGEEIGENRHITSEVRKKYIHHVNIDRLPLEYQANHPLLLPKVNRKLAEKVENFVTNPIFSPLISEDLTGIPECYIITAGHDVLRDDGFLYVKKLQHFKINVVHKHYEDTFHGVFNLIGHPLKIEAGLQMVQDVEVFLRKRYKLRD